MIVRYRLIQFRDDPLRAEGRNVGVIAWTDDGMHLRAIGINPLGRVDSAAFERFLPEHLRSGAWVYAEWAERWTDMVRRCEGNVERLHAELDRIEEVSGAVWIAAEGGELDLHSAETAGGGSAAREAADILYGRLVAGGMVGGLPVTFLEAVDTVLSLSETRYHKGFVRDESVAVGQGDDAETILFFPYLIDGPDRVGIKLACFNGLPWETVVAAVNDAVFTFDLAVAAGFLEREGCIVLVDTAGELHRPLLSRLAIAAHPIDVSLSGAGRRLWERVGRKR